MTYPFYFRHIHIQLKDPLYTILTNDSAKQASQSAATVDEGFVEDGMSPDQVPRPDIASSAPFQMSTTISHGSAVLTLPFYQDSMEF